MPPIEGPAMWPFNRRKKHQRTTPKGVTYDEHGDVVSFPVDNTDYEAVINAILDRAKATAAYHERGEMFLVALTEEERDAVGNPLLLMGPVMMRAEDYGLSPGVFDTKHYAFSKL